MGSIIDRALSLINDNLKDQTSSFQVSSPMASGKSMARGGHVLEDDYPSHYLPDVGRQVMAKGGQTRKGFEGRVSKKQPVAGPTSWDEVPTINPNDLVGKKIFPIFADLTKTGDPFMGIDASQLKKGVPLRGGPGYPLIAENVKHGIAWAVEGKGRGTAKLNKDADYAVVMAMNPDTHKSNATFSRALIGNMQAYVRDGRLSDENLQKLNDMVREPGTQKELQSLREFPGFEHPDAVDFIDGLSFEARKRMSEVLGSPGGQKLGAPNMAKIIRETADPQYAGVDRSAGLFLIELHPEKGLSNLKEEGLPEHESYTYGVPGRIVGKFHHPVASEILFKDYFDKKKADTEASIIGAMQDKATDKQKKFDAQKLSQLNDMVKGLSGDEKLSALKDFPGFEHKDLDSFLGNLTDEERRAISGLLGSDEAQKIGAPKSNLRRAFDLEMPVGTITQEIADMLPRAPKDIQSSQAARLALNVLHDRWHTSDDPVKEGGVSAANFSQALKDSDASSTLTQYSQKELGDMTRAGKFKAFKLRDGEVYFGLKHGTDYKDEYGFEHPELTPNETALVSVVNNEPGAKGIGGAPVVLKAIENGATALDAFAVPSKKHPTGFLPDFYSHFGFKELGRVPFDPKYVSEQQLADMKHHWTKNGWDESMGLPSLAIMKWTGTDDDRKDALRRYLEKGSAGDRQGANPVDVLSAAGSVESGASAAGGESGVGGKGVVGADRGSIRADSGARAPDRLSRTLAAIRGLTPAEAPHFGLTPEDVSQAQTAISPPARAYGGAINPPELRYDPEDLARRLILWSYAAAPIVRPLSRAEGGAVDDPVGSALSIAGAPQQSDAQKAIETARSVTPMGFYSAASEAAFKIPQRAPIDQILNKVKGSPGVKAEELDWSGVKDAFAGQRSVDPQEVARHFQENLPQLQETVKGDPVALAHKLHMQRQSLLVQGRVDEANALRDKITTTYNPSWRRESAAKFSEYTLPDGDNYREVLLHLPNKAVEDPMVKVEKFKDSMREKYGNRWLMEYTPEEEKMYDALLNSQDTAERSAPNYQSSHWNVPNVVAHLRMSDRDNGKTLHMEELQSDWGQEGRDTGFKHPDEPNGLSEEQSEEFRRLNSMPDAVRTPEENARLERFYSELKRKRGAIPPAPHVTSTEGWTDLGLKRALQEAAKGGYKKLVWTPGQAQADRFSLSDKVKHIMWSPDNNILSALTHDGSEAIGQKVERDDLHKYLGKEVARKLLDQEPEVAGNMATHHLRGQDISVGGEGMKNYYDRFLPKRLGKIVASLDPQARIEMHAHQLPGQDEDETVMGHVLHITPKLRAAILKGLPAYERGGSVVDQAFDVLSRFSR